MTKKHPVVDAFLLLRDNSVFCDKWRSDEDFVRILKKVASIDTSFKTLNRLISADATLGNIVDKEDQGENTLGVFRVKKKVLTDSGKYRTNTCFYYLQHSKVPSYPVDIKFWQIAYNKNRIRITAVRNPHLGGNGDYGGNGGNDDNGDDDDNGSSPSKRKRPRTGDNDTAAADTELDDDRTWVHKKTRELFGIQEGDVRVQLEARAEKLRKVMNLEEELRTIMSEPHEDMRDTPLEQEKAGELRNKSLYLRLAYTNALEHYKIGRNPISWETCCKQAIDHLKGIGIATISSAQTLMRWNRQFRVSATFQHPFENPRLYEPFFFRQYPHAKEVARQHFTPRLETLSCEYASTYFHSPAFLDKILVDECDNWDDLTEEARQEKREQMLVDCRLKTPNTSTAANWLRYLGFQYKPHERVFYSDKHEADENKKDRSESNKIFFVRERRKYKWVVLTEEQAIELERDEKEPLRPGIAYCFERSGSKLREYHVAVHSKLVDFVSEMNREQHGGDLSVRKRPDERPIIEVGQDESIFDQYAFPGRVWHGANGETIPRPKGTGDGRMVSGYIGPSIGFGYTTKISPEAIARMIDLRAGKQYNDKSSALEILHTTHKKTFLDEKEVQERLCIIFKHGKNREGYWNYAHTAVQFEDVTDILQGMFPGHDLEFFFDQSSGHKKGREGGLNVNVMRKGFSSSQPPMRDSQLTENCLGPRTRRCQPGDVFSFSFPPSPALLRDGPFYLSDAQKEAKRVKKPKGPPTLRPKKKAELQADLRNAGAQLGNRGFRLPELVEMARERGIPVQVEEVEMEDGWEGAPKGMFQVLWERGWIDETNLGKYKAKPGKNDVDEDGNILPEIKPFILPLLLEQCEDFQNELTALEHLAQQLSNESCTVMVHFTPKYHCELAGCGVESGWGLSKRMYRRKISYDEKVQDFEGCVLSCLRKITVSHARLFNHRVFRHRLAYKHFEESGDIQSYEEIKKFVDKKFKTHRSSSDYETGFIDRLLNNLFGEENP